MYNLSSCPFGTLKWQCLQCGLIMNSEEEVKKIMDWNFGSFEKIKNIPNKQKKFHEKAKKLKLI